MRRANKIPLFSSYPWDGKFNSLEEIRAYLNHDKLTCLLCGKEYANLTTHIRCGHHLDPDKYKERYCITYTSALSGLLLRDMVRKRFLQMVQEGKISLTPPEELVARIMACKKRPTNAAVRNTSRNTFLKSHGLTRKWGPQDFDEYLRRIQSGRTINEVGNDKDMPNSSMFYDYLRENPRFGKAFEKIWDSLAFAVQARGQKLGKRFEKEIKRLRRAGHMWSDIGRMLECHAGTAQSRWIRMGQKGKLRRGELVVKKIWRSDDYEKFLGRVSTGRTVSEVAADSDMPSLPCFYKYRFRNPAFRKRFEKIREEAPFEVQARSKHMGEAFKCAIVRLRLQELSWPQIGERTDLKPGTAKSTWSHLKRTGKLPRYIKLAKKALRANEYSSTP